MLSGYLYKQYYYNAEPDVFSIGIFSFLYSLFISFQYVMKHIAHLFFDRGAFHLLKHEKVMINIKLYSVDIKFVFKIGNVI